MNELENAREIINDTDKEIKKLFLKRMNAAKAIAEYKIKNGLPIFDEKREAEVIEKNSKDIEDEVIRSYYIDFLKDTMKVSKRYQNHIKEGMRIAFSGVFGAFAHIASKKIYGNAALVPYNDFRSAYEAVENGECDSAVLPIENSTAGEVGSVLDLLFNGSLYINGVYDLYVHQHLMAKKGCDITKIKKVISHPQALSQCADFLHGKDYIQEEFENTALAAKFVAESSDDTICAIASEETAELYGLEIIARNINEQNINTTRFATVSKIRTVNKTSRDRHSIIMFTVANDAGALSNAINIIGKYGYNMRCLRSRPSKDLLWNYYFYIEVEGNLDTDKGEEMQNELKKYCDKLKNFGSFKYPFELH